LSRWTQCFAALKSPYVLPALHDGVVGLIRPRLGRGHVVGPNRKFLKQTEVVMTHESRLLAGILLIVLPSVMVGAHMSDNTIVYVPNE
jgi:hypothetical protein